MTRLATNTQALNNPLLNDPYVRICTVSVEKRTFPPDSTQSSIPFEM